MRFSVSDSQLLWGKEPLGPANALFADANEKLVGPGVIGNVQTPFRIDYLMVAKNHVVGVESKTVNDLISSWIKGRLQRQLAVLFETVDIPVLMLRGVGGHTPYRMMEQHPALLEDLLKFQLVTTKVSPGIIYPASTGSAYYALDTLKENLVGTRKRGTVTSRYEAPPKVKGVGKRQQILRNAIKGCGPVMAQKLAEFGSLHDILNAKPKELRKAGATAPVLKGIEALKR